MSAPLEIAGKNKSTTKGNTDWYYGGGQEAYTSLESARLGVPIAIRPGKTVGILENNKIVEYIWHNDDVTDSGLVLKSVEVVDNLTSTSVDKPLSAHQGKILKTQQDVNTANINTNEEEIFDVNARVSSNKTAIENVQIADENGINKFSLNLFTGQKIKFKGAEFDAEKNIITGLWNIAKTILSKFSNSNTASRTYTLQDRNGVIADDTDLATKQDKFSGIINKLPKSIGEFSLGVSRLFDDGSFFGIGTTYFPTKNITLGNDGDKIIGVEESDANTKGRDLIIEAGRANDYRTNEGLVSILSLSITVKSMAISPTTNDFYILGNDDHLYKQINSAGAFVDLGLIDSGTQQIHISATNDLFITVNNFTASAGLLKQTNCTGSFVNIYNIAGLGAITTRDDNNKVLVTKGSANDIFISDVNQSNFTSIGFSAQFNGKAYLSYSNQDVYCAVSATNKKGIFKQIGGSGGFVNLGADDTLNYTGIVTAKNSNTYVSTSIGIFEQVNSIGGFTVLNDTVRNYSSIITNKTTGAIYASVGSELFELSFSQKGTANLDGGTKTEKAGGGKGTGKSRWNVFTGQKRESGTEMQEVIKRIEVDEEGRLYYTEDKSNIYTERTIVDKQYSDSLKYVEVSASRTLLPSDNGKALIVTATSVLLTIPATGLQDAFNCTITPTTGNDATIVLASGVVADNTGLAISSQEMKSIGRLGSTYIIRP